MGCQVAIGEQLAHEERGPSTLKPWTVNYALEGAHCRHSVDVEMIIGPQLVGRTEHNRRKQRSGREEGDTKRSDVANQNLAMINWH